MGRTEAKTPRAIYREAYRGARRHKQKVTAPGNDVEGPGKSVTDGAINSGLRLWQLFFFGVHVKVRVACQETQKP
jgi:hypothetical protein